MDPHELPPDAAVPEGEAVVPLKGKCITMKIDENDFFRQATLRISSSLDIEKAMRDCMNYLQQYIPISGMYFFMYDPDLNVAH